MSVAFKGMFLHIPIPCPLPDLGEGEKIRKKELNKWHPTC